MTSAPSATSASSLSERVLAELVEEFLARVHRGEAIDATKFVAQHPEHEQSLKELLPALEMMAAMGRSRPGSASSRTDPDGTDLGTVGGYRILREVGRGGMGVVYEAHHCDLNRRVALKIMLAGRYASAEGLRRFHIEAEAAAQLDHANVVPIYEVGQYQSLPFFSMKFYEGGTLAERLACAVDERGSTGIETREAARLVATIARAVHHAHQRGILHRDLKPSNILLDGEGRPYVTDFGLAKRLDHEVDATCTGAVLGSPPYMAPEQIRGDKRAITTAVDVYGLGAILYATLTGRPPFQGDSAVATMELVKSGNVEPPSRTGRRVDDDLEAICLKCLEKEPARRYRSAEELAEDLDRWLRGELTLARPLSAPARIIRWIWRRRKGLGIGVGALVILGLIGLGSWLDWRLRETRRILEQRQEAIRKRDEEVRQHQYVSDLRRASLLISRADAREARTILNRYRPGPGARDPRGFEWFYLQGLCDSSRKCWTGHEGRDIYHVEYSPHGSLLATAGGDGTARIWDAGTGRLRLVLRGHRGGVNWVSFDSTGTRVVTAGEDGTARVWDAANGKELRTLDASSGEIVAALFTLDGRDVISATRDCLLVRWHISTGHRRAEIRHSGGQGIVESLAIDPGGTTVALGIHARKERQGGTFYFHDLNGGGLTATTSLRPDGNANCVVFAPSGRSIAVTGNGKRQVVIYDVATRREQGTLEAPTSGAYSLSFAPGGSTLAVGDDDARLRVWDVETRTCRLLLQGHGGRIWCVAFAPDGRAVATTSRDGTVRLWDANERPDRTIFHGFSGEPPKLASSVTFSDDGKRVLAADQAGDVLGCDLVSGRSSFIRASLPPRTHHSAILAPGGASLAVSCVREQGNPATEAVFLHDLVGGRKPVDLGPGLDIQSTSWSPDGKRVAAFDKSGNLKLWDFTGRFLGQANLGAADGSSCPAFLPDGETLIAFCTGSDAQSSIQFVSWEPARSRIQRRPSPGVPLYLGRTAVAPDGQALATKSMLWDLSSLGPIFTVSGHVDGTTDAAFSPDGHTLATSNLDHSVRLWNVATGQELVTLEGHTGPVYAVAFSPDGRSLASCGNGPDDGIEVIVWRAGRSGPQLPRSPQGR